MTKQEYAQKLNSAINAADRRLAHIETQRIEIQKSKLYLSAVLDNPEVFEFHYKQYDAHLRNTTVPLKA